MQNVQSMKNVLNILKFVKYAEYAEYAQKRPFQCTKSGTCISVLTSWKVRTTQLPHLRFQHCPLPLASICCGAALLETVLHWPDTIDSMPAAAPPSPEQFLPDLKRVSINKIRFNIYGEGATRIECARVRRASCAARGTCGRALEHSAQPAVTRANLGARGSEVLCTRPAAMGMRLGHSMDRARRRGSTGCRRFWALFLLSPPLPSSSIMKSFNAFPRHNVFVHHFVSIVSSISGFP